MILIALPPNQQKLTNMYNWSSRHILNQGINFWIVFFIELLLRDCQLKAF